MKGMLYLYIRQGRKFLIAGAVLLVLTAAAGVLLVQFANGGSEDLISLTALLSVFLPLIAPITLFEPINADLDRGLKTRFTHNILCSGVSKKGFVLFYLLTNLATVAVGAALTALILGVMSINNRILDMWSVFPFLAEAIFICGAIDFMCMPITLKLRSKEKAALIVGLSLGFLVSLTMLPMLDNGGTAHMMESINKFWWVGCLIAAAVYAVTTLILYRMVRKGDIH